jgi:hypothetical protein
MRTWLHSVVNAILGKVPGKTSRLDTATRMALEADFSNRGERETPPRLPQRMVDQITELERILRGAC